MKKNKTFLLTFLLIFSEYIYPELDIFNAYVVEILKKIKTPKSALP